MNRTLGPIGLLAAVASAQPASRPADAEVLRARTGLHAALRPVLIETAGPDLTALVDRLVRAARVATRPEAERYLIYLEALECARTGSDLTLAWSVTDRLAEAFAIDRAEQKFASLAAHLQRFPDKVLPAIDALVTWAQDSAGSIYGTEWRRPLDKALELAATQADPALVRWTAARRERCLARNLAWLEVSDLEAGHPKAIRYECLYAGNWAREALFLGETAQPDVARKFSDLDREAEPAASLRIARLLLRKAEVDSQPIALENLQRRALHWYVGALGASAPEQRREIQDQIQRLVDLLPAEPGFGEVRFDQVDVPQSIRTLGGEWRVENAVLIGRNSGRAARAVVQPAWRSVERVAIRGGIRSGDNLNFRVAIGPLNLLINWELAEESHIYLGDQRVHTCGHIFEKGREHELCVLNVADTVLVMVDGKTICTFPGHLEGTISVYPAVGSEIFVKQIRIRGDPDLRAPVTGPSHPTR